MTIYSLDILLSQFGNSLLFHVSLFYYFFLTVASWPAYRFLRRQVRWCVIPIFEEFSIVCCDPHSQRFFLVNEAEVDVFLEFSCFYYDPVDAGNLISGSSNFSKSNLNIWKFSVHILLKALLENFEHYFTSVWDECKLCGSLNILCHWLFLGLEWKLTFSSPGALPSFPNLLVYWVQHFHSIIF